MEHLTNTGNVLIVLEPLLLGLKDKEIPAMHLKTNLETMGYDLEYLYNWIDKK